MLQYLHVLLKVLSVFSKFILSCRTRISMAYQVSIRCSICMFCWRFWASSPSSSWAVTLQKTGMNRWHAMSSTFYLTTTPKSCKFHPLSPIISTLCCVRKLISLRLLESWCFSYTETVSKNKNEQNRLRCMGMCSEKMMIGWRNAWSMK